MIGDPDLTVGSPNDGDLLTPTREAIVAAKNQIAMERAFTVDRINRLRRFVSGPALVKRERDEWKHFHDRTKPLEQTIDAMTEQAVSYLGLRELSLTVKWSEPSDPTNFNPKHPHSTPGDPFAGTE